MAGIPYMCRLLNCIGNVWMSCLYILYILIKIKKIKICAWNQEHKRSEKKKSKALVAMVCKMKQKFYFTIRVIYFKCSLEEHFAKHD